MIQDTKSFEKPKIQLEQYCIDAISAVDLLYFAGVEFDDVENRIVVDCGAGTGRLSIASAFLGAYYVISLDIDFEALQILQSNVFQYQLQPVIHPICADIKKFHFSRTFLRQNPNITTIMNPPFGVHTKRADRAFLESAFSFSDVIYSIHLKNEKVEKFISDFVMKSNWRIDYVLPFNLILEHSYPFHNKKRKKISVNIYRFIK